jgi:predicted metal-binding membrane protein
VNLAREESRSPLLAAAATVVVAAICWFVVIGQMSQATGMQMGLGEVQSFAGAWIVMTAAMMLPSALPFITGFARNHAGRREWPLAAVTLSVAYLIVWAAFGLIAYFAYHAIRMPWPQQTTAVGVALLAAGLYSFVPFKRACQIRCQAMCKDTEHGRQAPVREAVGLGLRYGINCIGCSAGLMIALLVIGLSSLAWMVIVGAIIVVYKVVPFSARLETGLALTLVAVGLSLALGPSTVPTALMPTS